MQGMTSEICRLASIGSSARLRDNRDGKIYWVEKLADGNCWMTQNLALDITEAGLKASDTDIEDDWNATTAAEKGYLAPVATFHDVSNQQSIAVSNVALSFNPGKYFYSKPTSQNICATTSTMKECTGNYGWIDVSSHQSSYDTIYAGAYDYTADNDFVYNAHYLGGNYYSWYALTAGQSAQISAGGSATQSICPKGWTLPSKDGNKSYTELFNAYGERASGTLKYGNQDIRTAPLYFVAAGGWVRRAYFIGFSGYYATKDTYSSGTPWLMTFSNNSIDITSGSSYGRSNGVSVRCVAK